MWDLRSLTKDQTRAPCSGSPACLPLDHQEAPGWLQFYQRLPLSLSRFQVFAVVVCLFCFVSAKLDATLIANLNFRRF